MPIEYLFETARNAPRLAGRGLIKAYQYTLSPFIGSDCRHLPTCSEYADEAVERYGLWAGSWMTLARLLRCHPFGTAGLDFVPAALPPNACWYMPWRFARWRGTNPGPPAPIPAAPGRARPGNDGATEPPGQAYLRSSAGVSNRSKTWSR